MNADNQLLVPAAGETASPVAKTRPVCYRDGAMRGRHDDSVVREEPLEIRVRGQSVAVTMRTPGHDQELAAGFLLTEGLVKQPQDIIEITPCQRGDTEGAENILNVFLAPSVEIDVGKLTRHFFASSSCGLCGKASIEAVQQHFPPVISDLAVSAERLIDLPRRLAATQTTFDQTGGLHAAAIFDAHGNLLVAREDVGRHNAVDKVIGHGLLNDLLPFDSHILLVSGRASFEIMQKALAARIPVVAAVSAPSSLAVAFAEAGGQTLIGFLRNGRFNIYTGMERITAGSGD